MFSTTQSAQWFPIQQLPHCLNTHDLYPNGKLLSDEEIAYIYSVVNTQINYKIPKGALPYFNRYTLAIIQGRILAVYPGENELGSGSYGSIKIAQDCITGELFALKSQQLCSLKNLTDAKRFSHQWSAKLNELSALSKANQLALNAHNMPPTFINFSAKKQEYRQYLLMPFFPGKTFSAITKQNTISLLSLLNVSKSIVEALQKLHNQGIIHGDLHGENILANLSTDALIIIDFGLSVFFDTNIGGVFANGIGDRRHIAPEARDKFSTCYLTPAADIYSLGHMFKYAYKNFLPPQHQFMLFINSMLANQYAERPDLFIILNFIEYMINQIEPCSIQKIGLLTIAEYEQSIQNKNKQFFLTRLSQYNKIYLLDHAHRGDLFYSEIIKDLQIYNITVWPAVMVSPYDAVRNVFNQLIHHLPYHPAREIYLIQQNHDVLLQSNPKPPLIAPMMQHHSLFSHAATPPYSPPNNPPPAPCL